MKRFRYWKLTHEEVGKLSYNPDNILNWDIKCTRGKDEDAQFFGVFLYRNGTQHDYEKKKGSFRKTNFLFQETTNNMKYGPNVAPT